jgi:hypothetical protein
MFLSARRRNRKVNPLQRDYRKAASFRSNYRPQFEELESRVMLDATMTRLFGPTSIEWGDTPTFTATVTPNPPDGRTVEKGTMQFYDNGGASCPAPVMFGTASCVMGPYYDLDCHIISAMYMPVAPWDESSDSLKPLCVDVGTMTSLSSEPNPSIFHEPVLLTASVRSDPEQAGTPVGQVTFKDGDNDLGKAMLDQFGNASFTTEDLGVGEHTLTVVYSGALHFRPSVSAPVIQTVLGHGPASSFLVQGPRTVDAGTAFAIMVSARDRFGNLVTGYTGTVHFTSSDAAAKLPPDYVFQSADKGVHTFSVTLFTGGVQTLTVSDASKPMISGTAYFLVNVSTSEPRLRVTEILASAIDLGWTRSANDHYEVYRSLNSIDFALIATLPPSQTSYRDNGLSASAYFYRVRAVNTDGGSSFSNTILATVGTVLIDHSGGFADHSDLVSNGDMRFVGTAARLTDNFGQRGSFYAATYVSTRRFTTTFVFRLHEGTQPTPADGFTFILQNGALDALGSGGGGLGFQGIPNSVAIKFDIYDNEGESDNSTGLFELGGFPGQEHNPGDRLIRLDPAIINLRSQTMKQVTLQYDGTTLTETITDLVTFGTFSVSYMVDLSARLGGGAAYVGFTGGTGGLYALQDILAWSFQGQPAGDAPSWPYGTRGSQAWAGLEGSWGGGAYPAKNVAGRPWSAASGGTGSPKVAALDRLFEARAEERRVAVTKRSQGDVLGQVLFAFLDHLSTFDKMT